MTTADDRHLARRVLRRHLAEVPGAHLAREYQRGRYGLIPVGDDH